MSFNGAGDDQITHYFVYLSRVYELTNAPLLLLLLQAYFPQRAHSAVPMASMCTKIPTPPARLMACPRALREGIHGQTTHSEYLYDIKS